MSANSPCIAVIDDETPIRRFLRAALGAEGFRIVEAATLNEGLRLITVERPDLVLLDLGLPDGEGADIIRHVREWSAMPFIVLSARGEEKSKLSAFDAGADDYLTKPFGVGELLARIRVALRHAARGDGNAHDAAVVTVGPLRIDIAARRVFRDEQEVELTKTEFDLLALLARHTGKVLTHRQLLKEVWGPHAANQSHYVRVVMGHLRRKLEHNPSQPEYLITEQGVGYRLQPG